MRHGPDRTDTTHPDMVADIHFEVTLGARYGALNEQVHDLVRGQGETSPGSYRYFI
jgi:hypothetical protein